MTISSEIQKFLIESIRKYFSKNDFEIILFGSHAKGSSNNYSDIDLAIKGKDKLPAHLWQEVESLLEESYLKQKIDLIDYHRVNKDFQKVIDQEGIKID